jgi:hypothetical protein
VVKAASKITASHRGRLAVVYVRQSSVVQVRIHGESTARQYGLAATAVEMGWAAGGVLTIDADLGVSGRFGAQPRRVHRTAGQGLPRGGRRSPLAVGYVHDDGEVIVDPDEQVRQAVEDCSASSPPPARRWAWSRSSAPPADCSPSASGAERGTGRSSGAS